VINHAARSIRQPSAVGQRSVISRHVPKTS
jgi:hypothetical protein